MSLSKREYISKRFKELGITSHDMAMIVINEQEKYNPGLTFDQVNNAIESIISKREIQHALVTALSIDELADKKQLPEPFQFMIEEDNPLYGVDEAIAIVSSLMYGTISNSNWGYLDKSKPGIVGYLNDLQKKENGHVTTMTDDMISMIIAGAEAKVSHNNRHEESDGE